MTKRIRCILLILVLMTAVISSAWAETSGVTITKVTQEDDGKISVLANLIDNNGNDVADTLSAESHYLVAENGEQKIATQAALVEKDKFNKVSYIILIDGTVKYQDALAIKQAVVSFGGSLNNEEMYVAYYHEEILREFNNFISTSKEMTGKNQVVYLNYTQNKPNMVGAMNYALTNIMSKANKDSQKAIIVITDTDADSYEESFLNQINGYLPIYFVSIGGQRNNLEQYAAKSGGEVYQGSGNADTITQRMLQIKSNIRTKAKIWFVPIYEVFTAQGETNMSLELNLGDKSVRSNVNKISLKADGVPTPTPDTAEQSRPQPECSFSLGTR